MIADGTGGANTKTGFIFEKQTSLKNYFETNNIFLPKNCYKEKTKFYKWVEEITGKKISEFWSKKLLPDEAIVLQDNIYIVEKKFQKVQGSVDEKPQTCAFKKWQYDKIGKVVGKTVHFAYLFSDFWNKPSYKDMFDFILMNNCEYFFNTIPLEYFEEIVKEYSS